MAFLDRNQHAVPNGSEFPSNDTASWASETGDDDGGVSLADYDYAESSQGIPQGHDDQHEVMNLEDGQRMYMDPMPSITIRDDKIEPIPNNWNRGEYNNYQPCSLGAGYSPASGSWTSNGVTLQSYRNQINIPHPTYLAYQPYHQEPDPHAYSNGSSAGPGLQNRHQYQHGTDDPWSPLAPRYFQSRNRSLAPEVPADNFYYSQLSPNLVASTGHASSDYGYGPPSWDNQAHSLTSSTSMQRDSAGSSHDIQARPRVPRSSSVVHGHEVPPQNVNMRNPFLGGLELRQTSDQSAYAQTGYPGTHQVGLCCPPTTHPVPLNNFGGSSVEHNPGHLSITQPRWVSYPYFGAWTDTNQQPGPAIPPNLSFGYADTRCKAMPYAFHDGLQPQRMQTSGAHMLNGQSQQVMSGASPVPVPHLSVESTAGSPQLSQQANSMNPYCHVHTSDMQPIQETRKTRTMTKEGRAHAQKIRRRGGACSACKKSKHVVGSICPLLSLH